MTNEIMVIIALGVVISRLKPFTGRENLGRRRRVLNYRAFYDFPRPACAPIGFTYF